MKRIVFLLIAVLLGISVTFAQEKSKKTEIGKNHFYTSLVHYFVNTFQLAYERDFTNGNSFMVVGGLILNKETDEFTTGITSEIHYRIKFHKGEHERKSNKSERSYTYNVFAYISPFLNYRYYNIDYERRESYYDPLTYNYGYDTIMGIDAINNYGGGILIGARWTFFKKLDLDIFVGGAIKFSEINANADRYDKKFWGLGYTGVVPRIGFNIGIAF